MGKRKATTAYVHNHKHNASARESDERKVARLQSMEIKRLNNHVDVQLQLMRHYIPVADRAAMKEKPDPNFQLKGAALAAQEFYRPPGYKPPVEEINLLDQLQGRMWEHEEGKILLKLYVDLATGMFEREKNKDAVKDPEDHLFARRLLLRCYLDTGHALEARQLLDRFAEDISACFSFSRALIEHIALRITCEEDSSIKVANDALRKAHDANPFVIWTLINHTVFVDATDHLEEIELTEEGGVMEALKFFYTDAMLWIDTEGAIEWLRDFVSSESIKLPEGLEDQGEGEDLSEESAEKQTEVDESDSAEEMFMGMYYTAIEMAESLSDKK